MDTLINNWPNLIFNIYTLIIWIVIVVIGVILGFKQKIVVFRDYNDLGLVFLIALSPIVLFQLTGFIPSQIHIAIVFAIIIEGILLGWIVIRTLKDNVNILALFVALITKISLSVMFILSFLMSIAPQGKTAARRAKSRYSALAMLFVVAPLVFGLVKNKTGFFNPEYTLRRRGIAV
ncbi:hypothetical protein D4S03_06695 [bacterium]|nr:MAG: hypothetical protein D4S03_06695 [bacterium]